MLVPPCQFILSNQFLYQILSYKSSIPQHVPIFLIFHNLYIYSSQTRDQRTRILQQSGNYNRFNNPM
jgi:hypothetical protein